MRHTTVNAVLALGIAGAVAMAFGSDGSRELQPRRDLSPSARSGSWLPGQDSRSIAGPISSAVGAGNGLPSFAPRLLTTGYTPAAVLATCFVHVTDFSWTPSALSVPSGFHVDQPHGQYWGLDISRAPGARSVTVSPGLAAFSRSLDSHLVAGRSTPGPVGEVEPSLSDALHGA